MSSEMSCLIEFTHQDGKVTHRMSNPRVVGYYDKEWVAQSVSDPHNEQLFWSEIRKDFCFVLLFSSERTPGLTLDERD